MLLIIFSPLLKTFFPLFIFCWLFFLKGRAAVSPEDTSRIISCRNFFNLTLSTTKPMFSTTLINRDDDASLKYRTVNPLRVGLAFDYRWFGIEISAPLPTLRSQDIRKGKTESSNFRFSINSRRFWVTTTYQHYKGFYLHNNEIFYDPLSTQKPLPQRPDIQSDLFQFSAYYVFNHKRFSNPAAVGQYERQIKSGGSPFLGFGLLFHSLACQNSLVPGDFIQQFPNLNMVRGVTSSSFYISGGYAYTLVWHQKYFVALYVAPGVGRYQVKEDRGSFGYPSGKGDIGVRFEGRSVVGYNGKHWYFGGGFFGYWNNERLLSGNYLTHTFQTVRIFMGRRFSTSKSLGFLGL